MRNAKKTARPAPSPTPEAIGAKFDSLLREEIGESAYAEVLRRNRTTEYDRSCASHDFCDANMTMCAALESFGISTDTIGGNSDSTTLFNAAWNAWRASHREAPDQVWYAIYECNGADGCDADFVPCESKQAAIEEAAKYLPFASGDKSAVYAVAVPAAVCVNVDENEWSLWDHLSDIPPGDFIWLHRGGRFGE